MVILRLGLEFVSFSTQFDCTLEKNACWLNKHITPRSGVLELSDETGEGAEWSWMKCKGGEILAAERLKLAEWFGFICKNEGQNNACKMG